MGFRGEIMVDLFSATWLSRIASRVLKATQVFRKLTAILQSQVSGIVYRLSRCGFSFEERTARASQAAGEAIDRVQSSFLEPSLEAFIAVGVLSLIALILLVAFMGAAKP